MDNLVDKMKDQDYDTIIDKGNGAAYEADSA